MYSFKVLMVFLKLVVAFLLYPAYYLYKLRIKQDKIIIGTRNGESGFDNGEIFYLYLLKKTDSRVMFVSRKPKYKDTSTVKKNSIRANLTILDSDIIYVTHSQSDIIDYWWRLLLFKKIIFIQHGVIGIKKLPEYERKKFDGIVASNEYEAAIFKKYYVNSADKIVKSGLPRFDLYSVRETCPLQVQTCLIMFTWRKYYEDNNIFRINQVVEKLRKIDPTLDIYIASHEMVKKSYRKPLNGINFVSSKDINNIIKNTDLLITDFSSVAWDYLYQNKLVCFIQDDFKDYIDSEGVYYIEDDFFGHFTKSFDEIDMFFLDKIISSNRKNNSRFLSKYHFYAHGTKKHAELLYSETRG
ncbi:CDP-glycerol glycerophosphotransferase family protein [Enterobacter ludwigii]